MYSQFCGRLASEGYVVIALEHRDGTSPAVVVRTEDGDTTTKHYLKPENIIWPEGEKATRLTIRTDQLLFRTREIYEAHDAFSKMINGDSQGDLHLLDESEFDAESWKDRVQCHEDVTLAGHSFGGATSLSLLGMPPPFENPLPISRVIVLDPWLEPLPGFCPPLEGSRPPIIVLNSEAFTLWSDHFEQLYEMVKSWKTAQASHGTLLTIVRSEHQSFSDFPVMVPIKGRQAQKMLDVVHQLSLAFIRGNLTKELATLPTRDMVVETKSDKRRLQGDDNDVIVHLTSRE